MERTGTGLALLALASLAGGALAAGDERTESPERKEEITVEEVLANPLDDRAYANTQRCLSTARYRRIDIIADRALVFYGRGDDAWLNVLPYRCRGLRRDMILSIEQSNFRVCALDRFKGLPRASSQMATTVCALGEFERLSHDQVESRRDALLAQGRNRTVARTLRSAKGDSGEGARQR